MLNSFALAGFTIKSNSKLRTYATIPATNAQIPLTIINGKNNGPIILITAGIHGGEYPGIAAAIELGYLLNPEDIKGCLILMHPVNIQAFWSRSPEIVPEDGKNLNREFPGDPSGTLAQKTAYYIAHEFQQHADFYIDMHSGDIHEELQPYVYYPGNSTTEITNKSREIAKLLDVEYMVCSFATSGAYNHAALNGTPSILIERGGNGFCLRKDVDAYKDDIMHILEKLNMFAFPLQNPKRHRCTPKEMLNVKYVTAHSQACWFHNLHSGARIRKGEVFGTLTDLFGTLLQTYYAEQDGIILYVTSSLAVTPGTVLVAYGKLED